MKNFKNLGFTLVEMLVVISLLSVFSIILLTIFTTSLKGGNKSQVIETIKQNGQSVLESISNTVRNADRVVCTTSDTVVVVKSGGYNRFKFIPPTSSSNGYIEEDSFTQPSSPPSGSDPSLYLRDFELTLCTNSVSSPQIITDNNTQTGTSVSNGSFTKNQSAGFKDQVVVKFTMGPGISAPQSVAGQVDPVNFQTTIQLR